MMVRILVINPLWPHTHHSIRAANVVLFELMKAVSAQPGVELGFLKLNHEAGTVPNEAEQTSIQALKDLGIHILEPWHMPPVLKSRFRTTLLRGNAQDFYPELAHRESAYRAAAAFKPDLLFIPWSEWATALFAHMPIKKFAYYGNPDPKAFRAQSLIARKYGGGTLINIAKKIVAYRLERIHLDLLRQYDYLGNVAANDANYYADHGLSQTFYIQNVWIDRFPDHPPALATPGSGPETPTVIANVGKLGGTANTFGLELLGRDILPALARRMNDRPYKVHILGSGQMHPSLRSLFDRPEVHIRGFVDDIDAEMAQSGIFLCANNGSQFNVGHTRYLHAWSLGCCVVGYSSASLAMPEIQNGQNALLGQNAENVAENVYQAIIDPTLRRNIGAAGYHCFRQKFTANTVVPNLFRHIGL